MENKKSLHRILDDGEVVLSKRGVIIGLILLPVYLVGLSLLIAVVSEVLRLTVGYEMTDLQFNLSYYVIMLTIVLLIFGKYIWASIRRAVQQKPRYIWIIVLYLGYLAILAFNMVSQVIIGMFSSDLTSTNQDTVVNYAQESKLAMTFMACVCAPIIEEVFFRGVLFRPFAKGKVTAVLAAVMSALLFASIHVLPTFIATGDLSELVYIVAYLPQGLIFATCCYKAKNICASMLLHLLNNAIAMTASIILFA